MCLGQSDLTMAAWHGHVWRIGLVPKPATWRAPRPAAWRPVIRPRFRRRRPAGLDSVAGIRRLLDVVVTDGIGLENGIARLRVLIAATVAATNLLKVGEFEERLAALESVSGAGRATPSEPLFPEEEA